MPTTRPLRCAGDPLRLLLAVSARTVLATAVALVLWAVLPAALGWHVTTVVSGSMAPAIRTGDVVAAVPGTTDDPVVGRVLLVTDPDHDDRLRLHRLARVEADGGLRLRGDANAAEDTSAVAPGDVLGTGVLRVPWVGLPGTWIWSGGWIELAITAAAAVVLVAASRADRSLRAGAPCPGCGAPRWGLRTAVPRTGAVPSAARVRRSPATITLGAGLTATLLAVTLVALALVAPSGAAFSDTTPSTARAGTNAAFPCFTTPIDGAVLAWDFHEKGGREVVDRSGHGQDAEFMTASPSRVDASCSDGPYSHYEERDFGSYAVTRTKTTAPNVFTVEFWFRVQPGDDGRVFGFSSDRVVESPFRDRLFYVDADGALRFGGEQSGTSWKFTLASGPVDDGEWHHAAGSFAAGELRFFLDGTLVGSRADAGTLRQYDGYWRTGRGSLGGWPNTGEYGFTGDVDTVRVHDRVLDPAEVAAHAARGR